ncbi:alpha,alpha-trehalase TreF [Cytophagaceae bacterium BD1B2-1]|uniref:Alpha,alpha-trehalase TreF n=1 Tax=Xanthocytophaga agilis TaxID=3048010 RepID=A0AAE3R8E5_9BACT|nr:alpha,alpha-trehalase TreF [Xanthocytophaga agilis]
MSCISKYTILVVLHIALNQQAIGQNVAGYQDFFKTVQLAAIFPDSKTFPDCTPKYQLAEIVKKYQKQHTLPDFGLKEFVLANYTLPKSYSSDFTSDTSKSATEHIISLWDVLTRKPEKHIPGSSLVNLPYQYVVPGGRFGEIYYWDSYFTMLGLEASGRIDLVQHMIDNFAFLIDTIGFIPNGNRTYYLTRSQPPFFALMVGILANTKGDETYSKYLPQLEKEYAFWMSGTEKLGKQSGTFRRVVRMQGGEILNRYWDDSATPRPEAYKEDVATADAILKNSTIPMPKKASKASQQFIIDQKRAVIYRHLRAAAESGWDFCNRWFKDGNSMETIHTTDIIPVDLNALMYNLEMTISKAYTLKGNAQKAKSYQDAAERRKQAVLMYCWDKKAQYFTDYDFITRQTTQTFSLAGMYPFFVHMNIGTPATVAQRIEKDFLRDGGVLTTLTNTGQQWDAPNGWAPLQWITYKGLKDNGYSELADKIKNRWISNNVRVYKQTGKMVEKYNVTDITLKAGGGEYPVQDGFGWSNGVLLRLLKEK